MLSELIREITQAKTPLTLRELSQRLGTDESALEGMIAHLTRTGRLADDAHPQTHQPEQRSHGCHSTERTCARDNTSPPPQSPASHSACVSCSSAQGCPFVAHIPRTISIRLMDSADV